ncbi:vWA domain-containing protein [Deinococcus yavapaiensis]|uniref:Putative metal-dependent peptidase n=1 Tax=Deinococcus yavapaiensis KR-236 TaxID=694435 RepID=A0A318SFX2_9DEIO|nr:VWA-like domain-containing protein [Deinococcus yavapaiensis]PYE55786.1 putative metal-dependent peptidase [Deinococcus yavapaiensis KR-236]
MSADQRELRLKSAVAAMRTREPFWGTLVLHARPTLDARWGSTACTDGRRIYVHPDFLDTLNGSELLALLAHEVAHIANLHVTRRGARDAKRWGYAADAWVNGALAATYDLPDGAVRLPAVEHLSVEEIYHLITANEDKYPVPSTFRTDLLEGSGEDTRSGADEANANGALSPISRQEAEELRRVWSRNLQHALTAARLQGKVPAGAERALEVAEPRLDWRTLLWRFVTPAKNDFAAFDRRFVASGLYLDTLEGERVRLSVCLDTSGSVGTRELKSFHAEVVGILRAYPDVKASLYHADAQLYGPHDLTRDTPLPAPRGGGGTDFRPYFDAAKDADLHVYLTDGYGTFPTRPPRGEVLWIVVPGGLKSSAFPFGSVTRLI